MKIPKNEVIDKVNNYHENKKEGKRYHFGVSALGDKCERKLWMNFRWCVDEQFSGRMKRLFRRGHMEELTIVEDLINAGFEVTDYGKDQKKVDYGSHVSSDMDDIIKINGEQMVLECKTHNDKSFTKLMKEGLKDSKFMHWVQCNVYMLGVGYTSCLYYAVNKNDDAVYTEIVKLDVELAEMYVERGQRIAMQDELPEPMTKNKTWWECKFCKYHGFCHDDGKITNKSCRTCRYSTACEDSA